MRAGNLQNTNISRSAPRSTRGFEAFPRERRQQPLPRQLLKPHRKTDKSKAIEIVASIATDRWQADISNSFVQVLGPFLWPAVVARGNCDALARAANQLLTLLSETHSAAAELTASVLRRTGLGMMERQIASALVEAIPLRGERQLRAIVRTIRIMGVYLCVIQGSLARCLCLDALAHNYTAEELEKLLRSPFHFAS